jgi:RNA polymerase sigma-70 factor (ECF subfamily)
MVEDEKELVVRARSGDRQAFDRLVQENKDKMFALTYRMTGDREAALDLMQETFFTAFREIRRFRGEASFSSWLYRIASNKSINYLRRKKILSFLPLTEKPSEAASYEMEDTADKKELAGEIAAAVNLLPPKQKLVFSLRFYEQLSFVEIARMLNKGESTVKTNYKKAVGKLQKRLKKFR